ncbi:MAG: CvpA family protein [bacterium]
MNWLDFVILAALVAGFFWSFRHGFIMEVIYFVAALGGLLGAFVFYPFLEPLMKLVIQHEKGAAGLAFALLFVFLVGLISIAGLLLHKFIHMIHLGMFDRLLGGVFGMVKASILVSVVLVMLVGFQGEDQPEYLENSLICKPLVTTSTAVFQSVPPIFKTFHEDYGQVAMKWVEKTREQINGEK